MGPASQDRVSNVVEMRHLNPVKQDGVLDLCGISDDAAASDDHIAPQESAGADLRVRTDEQRSLDGCCRRQLHRLVNVHILADELILSGGKDLRDLLDDLADVGKHFPRIRVFLQPFAADGIGQVIQRLDGHFFFFHDFSPYFPGSGGSFWLPERPPLLFIIDSGGVKRRAQIILISQF